MNEENMSIEELAADLGVSVEELRRRARLDKVGLTFVPLELRFDLEGKEAIEYAEDARRKFNAWCNEAWVGEAYGDNDVLKMFLLNATLGVEALIDLLLRGKLEDER